MPLLELPGWAIDVKTQSGLERAALRLCRGSHIPGCHNNDLPRVMVFADAVMAIQGDKRVAGSNV